MGLPKGKEVQIQIFSVNDVGRSEEIPSKIVVPYTGEDDITNGKLLCKSSGVSSMLLTSHAKSHHV